MIVELTPRLEAVIREKVDSGRYASAREVIEDALQLMENRDKVERLRAAIASADAQFANGEYTVWTEHSMQRLLEEAEEEERRGVPICEDVLP
jgi:antitoxin ParD1/3/4